jgi:hypothetical protein
MIKEGYLRRRVKRVPGQAGKNPVPIRGLPGQKTGKTR